MEFIGVYAARETLSKVLVAVQETPHVILRHGKPTAVVLGVEGKDILTVVRERFGVKAGDKEKMEFIRIRQARQQLSNMLEAAQKTPHVILNHGKPAAVVLGVDGREIGELVTEFEKKGRN